MVTAAIFDLVAINLFNYFVEQPSVEKMYGAKSSGKQVLE